MELLPLPMILLFPESREKSTLESTKWKRKQKRMHKKSIIITPPPSLFPDRLFSISVKTVKKDEVMAPKRRISARSHRVVYLVFFSLFGGESREDMVAFLR